LNDCIQSEEQPKTYDFAVVTLSEAFKPDDNMKAICLPGKDAKDLGVKVSIDAKRCISGMSYI